MSLEKYATEIERKIAARIVDDALAVGYTVSVNNGEETTVTRSCDRAVILGAMATTGEDFLSFYRGGGEGVGWVMLVYGNDREIVADNTVSPEMDVLLKGAEEIADAAD